MSHRIKSFLDMLPAGHAAVISRPENVRYLCGYTGEGVLFVSPAFSAVITDFRYTEQAQQEAPGVRTLQTDASKTVYAHVFACLAEAGVTSVCLETGHISHDSYLAYEQNLSGVTVKGCPVNLLKLRAVKDEGEIAAIRNAARLTDRAYDYLLTVTMPGMTELNLVSRLYQFFIDHGAEGFSFSPIIAGGENTSLPHAVAGKRVLAEGDLVTFDIGCTINGYRSDFTRTIALGKIDDEMRKVYDIVLAANMAALDEVRPGASGKALDGIARDIIAQNGYGQNFGHGLGHGVGLQIHEDPRLSQKSEDTLEPGMVVTVEPGIYIPGKGGVRIEDLVLVTPDGHEVLSRSGKKLVILY